jgi:hypothetical protein
LPWEFCRVKCVGCHHAMPFRIVLKFLNIERYEDKRKHVGG